MTMNDDLSKYPVYALAITGEIIPMPHIKTTADYNHLTHHIHHFIPKGQYKRNKKWFDEHGIEQKLFYIPAWFHILIHNDPAGETITDEQFERRFKISRWELIFNRRHSRY